MKGKILGSVRKIGRPDTLLNVGTDLCDAVGVRVVLEDPHGFPIRAQLDDPVEIDGAGYVWLKGIRLKECISL